MGTVINCKEKLSEIKDQAKKHFINYHNKVFYIISCGADKASKTYVNAKVKDFTDCGICCNVVYIPENNVSTESLISMINKIQSRSDIGGLIVQLPLPKKIDENEILKVIAPAYDVDGLTLRNTSLNFPAVVHACTAAGIVNMLENEIDLDGALVTVIGRSNIVGKPLIPLLLEKNATVTSCNSHTPHEQLVKICQRSNIIISAVGKPNFVTEEMVNSESVLVDVGINRLEDGSLVGDMTQEANEKAWKYTSVPGGVGLLTRAELINNFIKLNS